ncbi:MAG TPA: hypothetical protein VGF14_06620 [Alphaproteobacteria bacterium]
MLTRLIFILTLFGSAFLSFSIQPLLGKMMLPIVGGAAAAWIVAMAFFQIALLGGYLLSHLLRRVTPIQHGLVLFALYAAGLYFLPTIVPASLEINEAQFVGWDVLKILSCTIAVPFIALTATTSALLRIFSRTNDKTANDPYYLFMSSNAGSLIGLFIYPLYLEPRFDLNDLSQFWFTAYGIVMAGILLSLLVAKRAKAPAAPQGIAPTHIAGKDMFLWFCLAFVPCSLSMGVTSSITTDMGSFPLFWILPLGLYLLSFIFAFAQKPWVKLQDLHFWHICSASLIFMLITQSGLTYAPNFVTLMFGLCVLLGLFFIICWSCHQTLAALRPAPDRLTLYYLIIAFGGAVAGVLNAFVAPLVLNYSVEFPISVVLSLLLPMIWSKKLLPFQGRKQAIIFSFITLVGIGGLIGRHYGKPVPSISDNELMAITMFFFFSSLILVFKPRYLAVLGAATVVYYGMTSQMGYDIFKHRNFFGTSIVMQFEREHTQMLGLRHGNTLHGMVRYDAVNKKPVIDMAVGYYSSTGPVQHIYDIKTPKEIAILGLGTGQLSCYSKTSKVSFFEIDPDMVDLARDYFPYLKSCPPEKVVIGDARLTFAKEQQTYDLLILDAFSSDGIPIHILTREAIAMYPQHLAKNGLMLFHISNRYLSLSKQIAAAAQETGLTSYEIRYTPDKKNKFALPSQWLAVPLNPRDGKNLLQHGWHVVDPQGTKAWTDQRSSVLDALRADVTEEWRHTPLDKKP